MAPKATRVAPAATLPDVAASLDEAIARARADLVAAVGPGIDLTSPCCLSRSRRVDRLVVRYMRLRS